MLNQALRFRSHKPKWFRLPVMRRIAISTPNVMAALRRLRRDQARPYNFALSPVLVNLTNVPLTLLAPFEKDSSQWMKLPHVNIHDGTTHSLKSRSYRSWCKPLQWYSSSIMATAKPRVPRRMEAVANPIRLVCSSDIR